MEALTKYLLHIGIRLTTNHTKASPNKLLTELTHSRDFERTWFKL